MKILIIGIMILGSITAFAGGEIINRKTGERIELICGDEECMELELVLSIGPSKQIVKKVTPQSILKKVESLKDNTDYFPITDLLIAHDEAHIFYGFPLMWPLTLLSTAADFVYSAGAFAAVGVPNKIKISKIMKDVKRLLKTDGSFTVGNKRFNRVKSLIISL